MLIVRRSGFIKSVTVLLALIFSTGYVSAQVQTVTGTLSVSELSAGQSTDLVVSYNANDADGVSAYATGLGLRLHFDSSVVTMGDTSQKLFTGAAFQS